MGLFMIIICLLLLFFLIYVFPRLRPIKNMLQANCKRTSIKGPINDDLQPQIVKDNLKTPFVNRHKRETKIAYLFMSPYILLFTTFIIIPIVIAFALSFTQFNGVNFPTFNAFKNYIYLFTNDTVFMQYVLPNTLKFAVVVGPGGYLLSFFMAWCLSQIPHKSRTILTIILHTPSMTMGVALGVLWIIIFSGSDTGYLNSILLNLNLIKEPINWLQDPQYLMSIMIIISLWSSLGVGFLAMLSGILNINSELYEAACVDGMRNRFQEIFYITIPMMKPQMLFGAVMAVVNTFTVGAIGVTLSGSNPTPQYAGQLIVNHIDDYAYNKYEIGQAAAVSVILLLIILLITKIAYKLFGNKER